MTVLCIISFDLKCECHLLGNYNELNFQLAAVAKPEQGLDYTDVEESREGQAKANYSFEARNISELSLKKVNFLTKLLCFWKLQFYF